MRNVKMVVKGLAQQLHTNLNVRGEGNEGTPLALLGLSLHRP